MRELVRGYAAAVFDVVGDPPSLFALGEDLERFSSALVDFGDLRQVLADANIEPSVRRALVADLVERRVTPAAGGLLGFATYYERPSELGATVQALAGLAELGARSAGAELVAPPAGRSAARERLRGYAERVFEEIEQKQDVDRIEDELFAISRLLDEQQALRQALADSRIDVASRSAVLEDLLAGRAAPATVRLARYVLRSGRTRDLVGTFEWLVQLAARERGRRVAEVRSAVPLDETEIERLAAALGRLVARTVEVRVILDHTVVGGILVSVGDLVIDGTVRLRFERLRDLLVQPS